MPQFSLINFVSLSDSWIDFVVPTWRRIHVGIDGMYKIGHTQNWLASHI